MHEGIALKGTVERSQGRVHLEAVAAKQRAADGEDPFPEAA